MSDRHQVVYEGSLKDCQGFVRANRFSVLLKDLEIRRQPKVGQKPITFAVWAWRTDEPLVTEE